MADSSKKKSANLAAALAAFSLPRAGPKAAARPRPKRNRKPAGSNRLPKGLPSSKPGVSLRQSVDFWDPYGKVRAPPSSTSLGHFTTINGSVKKSFTVGSTARYLVVQWTPSGSKGFTFLYTPVPSGANVSIEHIYTSQMGYDATAVRPLRLSCYLSNQSKWREGSIDALMVPEPLLMDAAFVGNAFVTNAFALSVDSAISIHNKSLNITADLLKKRRFVHGPASFNGYNSYFDYPGGNAYDQHISGSKSYAMSTLVIRFNAVVGTTIDPNVQNYMLQTYCQDAVRYPADHAFASHAAAQPIAKSTVMDTINSMGAIVTEHGSIAHDVFESGLGLAAGRYGPSIAARAGMGEMFGEALMVAGLPFGL